MLSKPFTKEKLNINWEKIDDKVSDFFYSAYYPLIVGLLVLISFITNIPYIAMVVVLFFAGFLLVYTRDATPILPLIFYFMFMIRDASLFSSFPFYILVSPVVVCLIIHFIKFPIKTFNLGKLFLPLVFVMIAMFLGGFFSNYIYEYASGLLYIIPLGPVLIFVYLYFANYISYPENFNIRTYLCILLTICGVIVSIEYSYYYLNYKVLKTTIFEGAELGWGNVNNAGYTLLYCIPATCYLIVKSKRKSNMIFYISLVIAFYWTIYMTGSGGCLLVSGVFLPVLLICVYKHLKGKKQRFFLNFIFLAIIGALLTLIGLILINKYHIITDLINKEITSGGTGREKLYMGAWNLFLEAPIFGGGLGYYNHHLIFSGSYGRGHNFHSTFFQVIGCMGVAGLLAYTFYFYRRYAVIMQQKRCFNIFIYLSFTMLECYGMVDTVEFSTIPAMIIITLMLLVTEFSSSEKKDYFKVWKPMVDQ